MATARIGVQARGIEDLQRAIRAVNKVKDRELKRQLYAGLARAARPAIQAAKANTSTLPSGGGRGVRHHTLRGRKLGVAQLVKTDQLRTEGNVRDSSGASRRVESVADRARNANFRVKAVRGRNPAVKVTAYPSKGRSLDLRSLDGGRLRHPLFGNRGHWYSQAVTPGWFSDPMLRNSDVARRELLRAVDEVVRQLAGRG